jgi:hypothetical protein
MLIKTIWTLVLVVFSLILVASLSPDDVSDRFKGIVAVVFCVALVGLFLTILALIWTT